MKTDILKKSEGRNPRAERNPNAEARTDRPPISNLHRLARDSWLRTIAFSERQDYQTNPFLPNEPISTKRTHFYQTNPFLPNEPISTKRTHFYQTNPLKTTK